MMPPADMVAEVGSAGRHGNSVGFGIPPALRFLKTLVSRKNGRDTQILVGGHGVARIFNYVSYLLT